MVKVGPRLAGAGGRAYLSFQEALVRLSPVAALAAFLALAPLHQAGAQKAVVAAGVEPAVVAAGGNVDVLVTFSFPSGLHQTRQEEFFFARLASVRREGDQSKAEGFTAGLTRYPDGVEREGTIWYDSPVTLSVPVTVSRTVSPGRYAVDLAAGYQLCNDKGLCFFPQEQPVSVLLEVTGASPAAVSATTAAAAPAGLLRLLLMAFLGGLILNVMPCVLPVLSIKALSLVRQSGADRGKILRSALAYAAGILFSFVLLAVVVVALKASGELVGWGFQFQNPGYVIALLAVVFVFALSLFDVFSVGSMGGGLAAKASGSGGLVGSFLTGAVAVLLATPCTAPFLGAALGYAFSQPPATIFLMFAVVGVGLASPFVLLGFWPALVQRIPKPGAWTGVFRTVMGFLLIGTAVFLVDVLAAQMGGKGVVRVLAFLAVLAVSAWLYGRFGGPTVARGRRWAVLAVAALIGVAGGFLILRFPVGGIEGAEGDTIASVDPPAVPEGWEAFSPETVDRYVALGEPVFLAFGAKWCWTCRTNEGTVLAVREVREAFEERGVHLVHGDFTNPDDTVSEWLRRYGRAGVPLYVYFPPDGGEPVVLPEILTRRMVLGMLEG